MLPGPLQSFLMNTALKHGWQRAMLIVICPLIVDIPVIIAVLIALETLAAFIPAIVNGVSILGGLFVLYLAWGAWQDFRKGVSLSQMASDDSAQSVDTPRGTLVRGLLMNALSPGPYIFWSTVNGPTLIRALDQSAGLAAAFVVAFYGTFLGLLTVIAVIFAQLGHVNERLTRWLLLVVALLLTFFGSYLLLQGVGIV